MSLSRRSSLPVPLNAIVSVLITFEPFALMITFALLIDRLDKCCDAPSVTLVPAPLTIRLRFAVVAPKSLANE